MNENVLIDVDNTMRFIKKKYPEELEVWFRSNLCNVCIFYKHFKIDINKDIKEDEAIRK